MLSRLAVLSVYATTILFIAPSLNVSSPKPEYDGWREQDLHGKQYQCILSLLSNIPVVQTRTLAIDREVSGRTWGVALKRAVWGWGFVLLPTQASGQRHLKTENKSGIKNPYPPPTQ